MYRATIPLLLLLITAFAPSRPAQAAVDLQVILPACEFDLTYGSTGTVTQRGALRLTGSFGSAPAGTYRNNVIELGTDLELDCAFTGDGSNRVEITHTISNPTASSTPALRFFVILDPNGSALDDVPGVDFAAVGAKEPDFYRIDARGNLNLFSPGNLDHDILINGQLTNLDGCGASCDLVFALQWDIGVLPPGESALITVGLSDDGSLVSQRRLTATQPGSALTFSGELGLTGVNNAPTAAANTVVTSEDTTYTAALAHFGYSDLDGDPLAKIRVSSLETAGSLELSSVPVTLSQEISAADINAGKLKFVPVPNANGVPYDAFDFEVSDGVEYSASAYTMTVDVTAVNDAPFSFQGQVVTPEDTTYVFALLDFPYFDFEGDPFNKIRVTFLPFTASLELSGVPVTLNQEISAADINAGNLRYEPNLHGSGTLYDAFIFQVHDGTLFSNSGSFLFIDVTAVNDAPIGADNTVGTPTDTAFRFARIDFGYLDVDLDLFNKIRVSSLPTVGSLELSGVPVTLSQEISADDINAGFLEFVPLPGETGDPYDSFDFEVHDGTVYSAATYTMTIEVGVLSLLPALPPLGLLALGALLLLLVGSRARTRS